MIRPRNILGCLIIGGGPAGLTAATYLARFRRNFCVIDGQASRAELIHISHNYPAYPEGIAGIDLLKCMRQQAEHYGAKILTDAVHSLKRSADNTFYADSACGNLQAYSVVFATGAIDIEPNLPNLDHAIRSMQILYIYIFQISYFL